MELICLAMAGCAAVFSAIGVILASKKKEVNREEIASMIRSETEKSDERAAARLSETRSEIASQTARDLGNFSRALNDSMKLLNDTVAATTEGIDRRLANMASSQTENAENLRKTVDAKLDEVRRGNEKSLAEIRQSVDEKLQTTLEDRISRSFKEVSERLQDVYKGLGEMQNLAAGVGDLKKVLSNVKTRGILGEIQLGAILSEILSPEQYEENVAPIPGKSERVEFAVKMPGAEDGGFVYLPIDSKFPVDAYNALLDAYDSGDPDQVKVQRNELSARIKSFAKDIQTKYIAAPHTTDFAVMFLPTEGLYAEVVRMGLVEVLQRNYKINIAGPTTMAALLNSLQTGFRTLAIQKRSGEIARTLGAVKTEFEKFEAVLNDTQTRLTGVSKKLDELVGVRTRVIRQKLKDVSVLPEGESERILGETDAKVD